MIDELTQVGQFTTEPSRDGKIIEIVIGFQYRANTTDEIRISSVPNAELSPCSQIVVKGVAANVSVSTKITKSDASERVKVVFALGRAKHAIYL